MPPAVLFLRNRLVAAAADRWYAGAVGLLVAIHLAAFGLLFWFESDLEAQAAFLLTWGFLNFFWLALLRRPVTSAALSLAMIVVLIVLSQFKHSVLMMTATFVDLMIIDLATFSFLMTIIPGLAWKVALAVAAGDCAAGARLADRAVPGAAQHRCGGMRASASSPSPVCHSRCRWTGRASSIGINSSPSSRDPGSWRPST